MELRHITYFLAIERHPAPYPLTLTYWQGHRAGQHVDVRLTAEDGYQAERSYSIASAPEDRHLVLTVERLRDGEASPYLTDVLMPGDELELRGPIGGYFIWEEPLGGPLLLIAGGSGVAPFRAMLRYWSAVRSALPTRLLYSSRSLDDLIYRGELLDGADDGVEVRVALTRQWPDDWRGHRGRIDGELLRQVAWLPSERPLVYICGPTGFVEAAAQSPVGQGHDPRRVRTERLARRAHEPRSGEELWTHSMGTRSPEPYLSTSVTR